MPAPFVVIVPLNEKVVGQELLDGGDTNAETFVTAKAVGGVKVAVGVATGACEKPKLKLLIVPQPSKFTESVVELVGDQPAGVCACTR